MKTKCVVFDLDGTLVKSHKTILNTTIKTLEQLNINTNFDTEIFYNMLGHHFKEIFEACNIDVPDVEYFISIYKNLYFDFIDDSELYDNVEPVLEELQRAQVKTGLLTTKGHEQAQKISEHFALDKYLNIIEGRKKEIAIKPAPDQLLKICEELNVKPENTLMVGDTELDILCGQSANAKTCAVSYGYRKVEDIKIYKPDFLINDFKEILEIL